jgi:hypothetical protein
VGISMSSIRTFRVILSMDADDRGYNAGVRVLTGTSSSNAKLGRATNADTKQKCI